MNIYQIRRIKQKITAALETRNQRDLWVALRDAQTYIKYLEEK